MCIFCKIVAGEIPSAKVYEDDYCFAFKDINPMAPVHVLVVPKEHICCADAVNADNSVYVAKIFEAKGRPQDNPLIVHLANPKHIKKYVQGISQGQKALIKAFMPGPISIIFDRNDKICSKVCAGNTTVAIIVPENKVARKFIKHCHRPICAPSANSSHRPSTTLAKHVFEDLDEKIAAIIDGGQTDIGIESTVVKISICLKHTQSLANRVIARLFAFY